MCLYSWDYTINHNENEDENEKTDHLYTTQIDLDLVMDTDVVNAESVSVWWCLYVLKVH